MCMCHALKCLVLYASTHNHVNITRVFCDSLNTAPLRMRSETTPRARRRAHRLQVRSCRRCAKRQPLCDNHNYVTPDVAQALSGFQDDERVEIAPPPVATSAAGDTTFGSNKTLDSSGMAQRHSQYDHAAMAKRYPATVIVPGMLGAIVSSSRLQPKLRIQCTSHAMHDASHLTRLSRSSSSRSMLSMSRSATTSRSLLAVRSNADHVNLIEDLIPQAERSTVTLRR